MKNIASWQKRFREARTVYLTIDRDGEVGFRDLRQGLGIWGLCP